VQAADLDMDGDVEIVAGSRDGASALSPGAAIVVGSGLSAAKPGLVPSFACLLNRLLIAPRVCWLAQRMAKSTRSIKMAKTIGPDGTRYAFDTRAGVLSNQIRSEPPTGTPATRLFARSRLIPALV